MSGIKKKAILRKEQDILDRIENVKRLIQMEYTLLTSEGCGLYGSYHLVARDGNKCSDMLIHELRDSIQLQLLSIAALCYGDNPDIGEPVPMLEWNMNIDDDEHPSDVFWDEFRKCLVWSE